MSRCRQLAPMTSARARRSGAGVSSCSGPVARGAGRVWGAWRCGSGPHIGFRGGAGRRRQEMEAGLFNLARTRLARLAAERPGEAEVAYRLGRCEAARGPARGGAGHLGRIRPDSPWAAPAALEFAQAAIPTGPGRRGRAHACARPCASRQPRASRRAAPAPDAPGPAGPDRRGAPAHRSRSGRTRRRPSADDVADRLAMLREHVGLDLEPFPLEWNLSRLQQGPTPAGERGPARAGPGRVPLWPRKRAISSGREAELDACLRAPAGRSHGLEVHGSTGPSRPTGSRRPSKPSTTSRLACWTTAGSWSCAPGSPARTGDAPTERRALEELVALEPGRSAAVARLAELLQQAGEPAAAARSGAARPSSMRRSNATSRSTRKTDFAEHLPELASLAERLGRRFEARAFWELVAVRGARRSPTASAGTGPPRLPRRPAPRGAGPAAQMSWRQISRPFARGRTGTEAGRRSDAPLRRPGPRPRDWPISSRTTASRRSTSSPRWPAAASACSTTTATAGSTSTASRADRFPPGGRTRLGSGDRLFRNRGDGTFEDVTRTSGIAAMPRGYGHGVAVGDYRQRRPSRPVRHPLAILCPLSQPGRRHVRGRHRAGRAGRRSRLADLGGLRRPGRRRRPRPLCLPLRRLGRRAIRGSARIPSGTHGHHLRPPLDRAAPRPCLPQRRRPVRRRDGRGRGSSTATAGAWASSRPTSTATAGSTCSSPTTARPISCSATWEACGSRRSGTTAGVAANAGGGYQAGMGVACGDLDGDGRPDLAVTNFYGESTTFFHNLGQGLFADHTAAIGLAAAEPVPPGLRRRLPRRQQRRLARPDDGQRARQRQRPAVPLRDDAAALPGRPGRDG